MTSQECTTEDCGNQTSTYLCGRCVDDLQAWIDKVPALLAELPVTIAKLDNVRPAGGGGCGSKPGSKAPINLDAVQLQQNLLSIHRTLARIHAENPNAAGIAWLIADWVTKAELMISGPEAEHINHTAIRERVRNIAPPMPTKELTKWLRDNARIHVTSMDIRNWVRRRKLFAVEEGRYPTYHPHEVLAAWHDTRATSVASSTKN
jgi:hypothetical protein